MNNEPTPQQDGIAGVFNRAASTYDQVGPQIYGYFGQRLVDLAGVTKGSCILDVAAGRGAILFPAATLVGATGSAIGIDLAQAMVDETKLEILQRKISQADMHQMDATDLQFPDSTFDRVFCGISIGFFPDPQRALQEFHRVLKPGGRVAISTWPDDCPYVDWVLRGLNAALPPPDTKAAKKTQKPRLNSPDGLQQALQDAAFGDVRMSHEQKDFVFADDDVWWSSMWSHALRGKIENLNSEDLARVKAEMLERAEEIRQVDGIHNDYRVLFALGTKPVQFAAETGVE